MDPGKTRTVWGTAGETGLGYTEMHGIPSEDPQDTRKQVLGCTLTDNLIAAPL